MKTTSRPSLTPSTPGHAKPSAGALLRKPLPNTYTRFIKLVLRPPIESAQYTSIRYGERLAEIGAVPSIGTVGDSFDNALAETVNGYYKSELIYGPARPGPWKTVEDVELATLGWVHWHNTQRLHGYLGDLPPAEYEAAFYATTRTDQPLVGIQ
jgi:putative transposase